MKVSLCITVLNEADSIETLLKSISLQTRLPDEVLIVDGGSTDTTVSVISNFQFPISNKQIQIVIKKGNRAIGRNEAIKKATGDIIAITDAGCELDKNWLKEILKPFENQKTQVVSGYYAGKPANAFEASLVPYVLVMSDKVKNAKFLPSTRSMAMKKSIWEKVGGFPSKYRWNEDYVFSKELEKQSIPITFASKAIVYWFPRKTLMESFWMFYAFAKGDTQAGIWRPKVMFLLSRMSIVLLLLLYALITQNWNIVGVFVLLFVLYSIWAIQKNYRYVQEPVALFWLPVLQYTADIAVSLGTIKGFLDRILHL